MRTSKDVYRMPNGSMVEIGGDDVIPYGAMLWHGYDYTAQRWIYQGQPDTRSVEELQAELDEKETHKDCVIEDCDQYAEMMICDDMVGSDDVFLCKDHFAMLSLDENDEVVTVRHNRIHRIETGRYNCGASDCEVCGEFNQED